MGTSSNFGNMFSAAGASLFLSFLPMLPTQILLNNLLYDVSEMTIPTDDVDEELLARPSQWDIGLIRRFMSFFGPISSLYDFLTFAVMLRVFDAGPTLFQSGWFVESLTTQTLVIFVIRTRRVPFQESPSRPLLAATLSCATLGVAIPYIGPLARLFGFEALPLSFLAVLAAMIATYLALAQVGVALFFRPQGGRSLARAIGRRERRIMRTASRWNIWSATPPQHRRDDQRPMEGKPLNVKASATEPHRGGAANPRARRIVADRPISSRIRAFAARWRRWVTVSARTVTVGRLHAMPGASAPRAHWCDGHRSDSSDGRGVHLAAVHLAPADGSRQLGLPRPESLGSTWRRPPVRPRLGPARGLHDARRDRARGLRPRSPAARWRGSSAARRTSIAMTVSSCRGVRGRPGPAANHPRPHRRRDQSRSRHGRPDRRALGRVPRAGSDRLCGAATPGRQHDLRQRRAHARASSPRRWKGGSATARPFPRAGA